MDDFHGQSYIPNSASLPLVSPDAARRVSALQNIDVQVIPAVLICSDGQMEIALLNPLRAVAAVDWSTTKAVLIPGTTQVMKFNKLHLRSEPLENLHLVRLEEFRPFLLASKEFKAIFEKCPLCEFTLPSSIRP